MRNARRGKFRCRLKITIGVLAAVFGQTIPGTYVITEASASVQVSSPGVSQLTETAVAADPTNIRNLFVSSNEGSCATTTYQAQPAYLSSDGGLSWSSGQALPITPGHFGLDPAPAFDSNGVLYDAYLDVSCLNPDGTPANPAVGNLVAAKSTDKGAHWSTIPPIETATQMTYPDKPMMLVDTSAGSPFANRLYVVYSRVPNPGPSQPLEVNYSTNGGTSWQSTPTQVDAGNDTGGSLAVGPANGVLYAAWWDYTHQMIRTSVSTDGGAHFAATAQNGCLCAATTILTGPPFSSLPNYMGNSIFATPTLGVDRSGGPNNGNIYVVWNDRVLPPTASPVPSGTVGGSLVSGTGYQIGYTYVSANGESAPSALVGQTLGSGQNAIQVASLSGIPAGVFGVRYYLTGVPIGSGVATGYVGSSAVNAGTAPGFLISRGGNSTAPPVGQMHIFFTRSTDDGRSFLPARRLDSGNPNDAWEPTLSVDQSNGNVAVAWYDRRDDPNDKLYHVYYTQSSDGGWTFPSLQTTVSTGPGADPSVSQTGTGRLYGDDGTIRNGRSRLGGEWKHHGHDYLDNADARVAAHGGGERSVQ